jgi:hypothetical protein
MATNDCATLVPCAYRRRESGALIDGTGHTPPA